MLTDQALRAALLDLAEHDVVWLKLREDAEQVWRSIPPCARPCYHVRECRILRGWLVEKTWTSASENDCSDLIKSYGGRRTES